MKKLISLIVLIPILLMTLSIPTGMATAATVPPLESSIQVQNLDSVNPAQIDIYYYDANGVLVTLPSPYTNPVHDTINPGTSATYLPIHPGVGFSGSSVVMSDRPIAIISNLTVAATNRGLGTFVGIGSGSSNVYFPLVDKRSNVSVFSVQNVETSSTNITIDFIPQPGSPYPDIANINDTIAGGAAHMYYMANYGPSSWLGSIKVNSPTGKIAGVLSNINQGVVTSPMNAVYNGFASGSNKVVLPLLMQANNGNRTGTSCQNLGPSTATITIDYSPASGFPDLPNMVISNVDVNGIAVQLFAETGTRWIGSAIVSASGGNNIACVVNQSRPSLRRSNIYEGFNPNAATKTVILPLIMSKNGSTTKTFTGFSVASVDGSNINVTCDWLPGPGFPDIANTNQSGAPILVYSQQTGFSPSDSKWVGSAICTENGNKPIVAVVNQSREGLPSTTLRDVTSAYIGFNQ